MAQAGQQPTPIGLVTDSLAWLPADVASAHGITVVPLHVTIGDAHFTEGVDLTNQEFFRRMRESPVLPKTSQPAAGEFLDAYRAVAERAGSIVSIHATGKLSGTVRSAEAAAGMLRSERPDFRIDVVDTGTIATSEGITAIRAAEAIAGGATHEQVMQLVRILPGKTRLLFVLETLEYLQKGGRIGRARAFLGSLLQIRPILAVEEGEVVPKDRARTRAKAMERCLAGHPARRFPAERGGAESAGAGPLRRPPGGAAGGGDRPGDRHLHRARRLRRLLVLRLTRRP
jgi:DegV family protein with EDD domain